MSLLPLMNETTGRAMPRYKCHKEVHALKIKSIEWDPRMESAVITPADEGYEPFSVDAAYMDKHDPQVGGYYVVYDNGQYISFSPAGVFEDGYTRIE